MSFQSQVFYFIHDLVMQNIIMHMTLRNKLLFLSFIPFLMSLWLSITIINDVSKDKEKLLKIKLHVNKAQHSSILVHNLQNERGLSTIFILQNNDDSDIGEILLQARQEVDIALHAYSRIENSTEIIQEIQLLREEIDNKGFNDTKKILDAYTKIIKQYQTNIKLTTMTIQQNELRELIQTYDCLFNAKESLAKIRGLLNERFINESNFEVIKRVFSYQEFFINYINDFEIIAPKNIKKIYIEIIDNKKLEEIFAILEEIQKNEFYFMPYYQWFTHVTSSINDFYDVEQLLFEKIEDTLKQSIEKLQNTLSLLLAIMLFIIFLMLFVMHFLMVNIIECNKKLENSCETAYQLLEQYKNTIDKSFIVSKTDQFGNIAYVNKQFCEISQYTSNELIGKSHNIIRHPDTPKNLFLELWDTIQKGTMWHGVIKNKKKDGSSYWVDSYIHPIIDLHGNITEYISIRHNVTSFYIMNDDLYKSLELSHTNYNEIAHLASQYEKVINKSNSVIRFDLTGKILFINDRFSEISGYSLNEILTLDYSSLYADDMDVGIINEMLPTLRNGSIWTGILKNKHKHGTPYWVKATVVPIKNREGDIIEFMSIRNDITEVINLQQKIEEAQQEVIYYLGEIAESRSKETGNHVKRVAEYSRILALLYGLDQREANLIASASPMHDIGKVGIPDNILHKKEKLTEEEWKIMQTHTTLGYNVFKNSANPLLQAAAIIAKEHHEKYDGTGYPEGLKKDEIHLYARIVAIADVFDALSHNRCYKTAWEDKDIFQFFKQEKEKHFDPKLTDLFLNSKKEFLKIRNKLRNTKSIS